MKFARIGRVQLRIMRILWARGEATAREITELLNAEKPIAHSTVQTLLRQLEQKRAVTHAIRDRVFVFRAVVEPEKVQRRETKEFIETVFDGSAGGLVAYLLRHERIPAAEMEQIRALVEQARESERECSDGRQNRGRNPL